MKFDLTKLDYSEELTIQLRAMHKQQIEELVRSGERDNHESGKVSLFHGTSMHYLNNILLNGLEPRGKTNINNFDEHLASNQFLVYLTNKWHYWYAYNTYGRLNITEKLGMKELNLPCYVEFEVDKKDLVIDEDFFHSRYVHKKVMSLLNKGESVLELTVNECLSQYATVAHIGKVERKNLKSFTMIGNADKFFKNFINDGCQYNKDFLKWSSGRGKGVLKFWDLVELEDDKLNLTFFDYQLKDGYIVNEIVPNPKAEAYSLLFTRPLS